jgi:hypothetical protein
MLFSFLWHIHEKLTLVMFENESKEGRGATFCGTSEKEGGDTSERQKECRYEVQEVLRAQADSIVMGHWPKG